MKQMKIGSYSFACWFAFLCGVSSAVAQNSQNVYNINTALDVTNLEFMTIGTGFSLQNESGAHNGTAIVSNPTGNNRNATLRLKIEGPLRGSFRWKVSSEQSFDERSGKYRTCSEHCAISCLQN